MGKIIESNSYKTQINNILSNYIRNLDSLGISELLADFKSTTSKIIPNYTPSMSGNDPAIEKPESGSISSDTYIEKYVNSLNSGHYYPLDSSLHGIKYLDYNNLGYSKPSKKYCTGVSTDIYCIDDYSDAEHLYGDYDISPTPFYGLDGAVSYTTTTPSKNLLYMSGDSWYYVSKNAPSKMNNTYCLSTDGLYFKGYFDVQSSFSVDNDNIYCLSFWIKSKVNYVYLTIDNEVLNEKISIKQNKWTFIYKVITLKSGVDYTLSIKNKDTMENESRVAGLKLELGDYPTYYIQKQNTLKEESIYPNVHNSIMLNFSSEIDNSWIVAYTRKTIGNCSFSTIGNITYGFNGSSFYINNKEILNNYQTTNEPETIIVSYHDSIFTYERLCSSGNESYNFKISSTIDSYSKEIAIYPKSDRAEEVKCNVLLGCLVNGSNFTTYSDSAYKDCFIVPYSDNSLVTLREKILSSPTMSVSRKDDTIAFISKNILEETF